MNKNFKTKNFWSISIVSIYFVASNGIAASEDHYGAGLCYGGVIAQVSKGETKDLTTEAWAVWKKHKGRIDKLQFIDQCNAKYHAKYPNAAGSLTFKEIAFQAIDECKVKITKNDRDFVAGYQVGLQGVLARPDIVNATSVNLWCFDILQ